MAAVETRLTYDVLLDVPEMSEPATARLISVPESGDNQLNRLYVSRGRMIEPERTGEVVVSEVFADAHGFVPGDSVTAILNGRSQQLRHCRYRSVARVCNPSPTWQHHAR